MFVEGNHRIALYASRKIRIGEEILFDYGADFKIDWLTEFNKRAKKFSEKRAGQKKLEKVQARKKIDIFTNEDSVDFENSFKKIIS